MELIKWNNAKKAIAECKTIDEIKSIRDRAEAMRAYAKQAKESLLVQNDLCEIKLRAERRAGEMLKEVNMPKNQYDACNSVLQANDISRMESSRWQKIANIPEETFENIITETKEQQKELTESMMLKVERQIQHEEKKEIIYEKLTYNNIDEIKKQYDVIYADPAWGYADRGETKQIDGYGTASGKYKIMGLEEIKKMNVKKLRKINAILFLWVTSPYLEMSFEVIKEWGFKYKSSFVWDKIKHNMGFYNSVRHEFLLICTHGNITPWNKKLFDSVYSEERTEHSKKPDYFYNIIETLYPNAEYIELFARNNRDNWDSWGNEI